MTDITLNNMGVKLAASVYGGAEAEPLLFLHGASLSRDTWEEITWRLMDRYQVWTFDFRGHGHSDWASGYELSDYVSDAETVLAAIGKPAIVVGHSLGGCVAGVLAQGGAKNVRAVFLEDPPWYLGEAEEWARSIFPKVFSVISAQQLVLQKAKAPLETYLDFVSKSPSPMGGIASNHFRLRHLLSNASSLQRQDNRCWENVGGPASILAAIATGQKFLCPTKIVQADPKCGAALLEGHDVRLAMTNPNAEIVRYAGSGHRPHAANAFEERFIGDIESFVLSLVSH